MSFTFWYFSIAPAKHVIEYERRTLLRTLRNNPFTGEPREELEEAWHNLLSREFSMSQFWSSVTEIIWYLIAMIIKITEEELRANGGLASIPFADGSGYMAETAVYHQLHCIVGACINPAWFLIADFDPENN